MYYIIPTPLVLAAPSNLTSPSHSIESHLPSYPHYPVTIPHPVTRHRYVARNVRVSPVVPVVPVALFDPDAQSVPVSISVPVTLKTPDAHTTHVTTPVPVALPQPDAYHVPAPTNVPVALKPLPSVPLVSVLLPTFAASHTGLLPEYVSHSTPLLPPVNLRSSVNPISRAHVLNTTSTPTHHNTTNQQSQNTIHSPHSNDSETLSLYYQNTRGLNTKISDVLLSVLSSDYDVIIFTETWLKESTNDCELFGDNYSVYRCDRCALNSDKPFGGGVLIAVDKQIPSQRIHVTDSSRIEIVFVKVVFQKVNIFIACIYIPSGSPASVYIQTTAVLSNFFDEHCMSSNDVIICIGDFNLPHVTWAYDCDTPSIRIPVNSDAVSTNLLDLMSCMSLYQLNSISNFMGRILDLVYCTSTDNLRVVKCNCPLTKVDKFHYPIDIFLTLESHISPHNNRSVKKLDFKKADFTSLNLFLNNINWKPVFDSCDIQSAVKMFYDLLEVGFLLCIPLKDTRVQSNLPCWYSKQLKHLKNVKNKAFRRYCKSLLECDYLCYSALRNKFKSEQRTAYSLYLTNVQNNINRDPSLFWQFVKSKQNKSDVPPNMFFENTAASCPSDICSLFKEFFSSVYSDTNVIARPNLVEPFVPIGNLVLNECDILNSLMCLNANKGCGPDDIPAIFLVNCAQSLFRPLTYLFNLSLTSGIFPTIWKTSYIRPIYKSGSKNNVKNYRGISIASLFGKLFESIVTDALSNHFARYLSPLQHGFTKGRSVNTNLVEFTNLAVDTIDRGSQLEVVYTDFSKAFDRVNLTLLINKLTKIGIYSSLLDWIHSYLSNRNQFVRICGTDSTLFYVTSGVPQGSHLGPLLFNLFVNDVVHHYMYVNCLIYADDMKLFAPVNNVTDANKFQSDLNRFAEWCTQNDLSLNVEKCKHMSYNRKLKPYLFRPSFYNIHIETVIEIRDLGVLFSKNLSFDRHIDCSVSKALSMLGFMKRICYNFTNVECLKSIYFAHVRSHLEFACIVWSPSYENHIVRLESVQKNFVIYALRHVFVRSIDNFALPPYLDRCKLLSIKTLSSRRANMSIMFVFDVLTSKIDASNILSLLHVYVPHRQLRGSMFFRIPYKRTNYARAEPIYSMCCLFNSVSDLFDFGLSRLSFKNSIQNRD